jgi:hypothetical protein
MKIIRVLILEDDLETLSKLTESLVTLQKRFENLDLALTILAEYTQVAEYLNKADKNIFDLILLDRDCKACGSFHCLDLSKYPVEKIIGISSVPPYNEELRQRGVTRIVHKDYQALGVFVENVEVHLVEILRGL